ncbi:MAG: hypothetical protein V3V42_01125, partial [Candidatus Omnitrophota bacterium]
MKRAVFYSIILVITLGLIIGIVVYNKRDISQEKESKPTVTSVVKIKDVRGEFDIQNAFIKVADKAGKAV